MGLGVCRAHWGQSRGALASARWGLPPPRPPQRQLWWATVGSCFAVWLEGPGPHPGAGLHWAQLSASKVTAIAGGTLEGSQVLPCLALSVLLLMPHRSPGPREPSRALDGSEVRARACRAGRGLSRQLAQPQAEATRSAPQHPFAPGALAKTCLVFSQSVNGDL